MKRENRFSTLTSLFINTLFDYDRILDCKQNKCEIVCMCSVHTVKVTVKCYYFKLTAIDRSKQTVFMGCMKSNSTKMNAQKKEKKI